MIDMDRDGTVNYEEFKSFWTHFLQLYGETLQTKLQYDENVVKMVFNEISKRRP